MHSEHTRTVSEEVMDTGCTNQSTVDSALSPQPTVRESLIVERINQFDAALAQQVKAIYMEAFPPSEREPFYRIISAVNRGTRWLFCACSSTCVYGFAITVPLPDMGMHLLEYLAAAVNMRNRGIGAALVRDVQQSLRVQGTISGIVLEAESDEEGDPVERPTRRRRIEFYRRMGAIVIEGVKGYTMPDMRGSGYLAMKLLWLPVISSAPMPDGPELRACIVSIYRHSYGLGPDNPLVRNVLASLQESDGQGYNPLKGVTNE